MQYNNTILTPRNVKIWQKKLKQELRSMIY